ncbi:hypothetical protein [Winogradskyella schleiferi]|uniref:hypothetical protein n=1 Tax=Winogradskyella schleiferi TaxID=2686078 RepID=UPI0015BE5A35|nr:hypothetical protein [Winogradskyella schleiferi]
MIKSIQLLSSDIDKSIGFTEIHDHKTVLNVEAIELVSFTLKIELSQPIVLFRNHDYTWVDVNKKRIANWFAPKLLKLKNNRIVQANQNSGIWEVNPKKNTILYWHFNPKNANPIANYDRNNTKHIINAVSQNIFDKPLALLFTNDFGIEVSRSKFPFSAIVCFTDHCDFDTEENLVLQRQFFKRHNIKVTKGFFLNHFSKREDTASFEFNSAEIEAWIKDGHELAYHSLSQSIKSAKESFQDFLAFKPPFGIIKTWIDHGFQPYNFTLYSSKDEIKDQYGHYLKKRNISQLWNYIDSGTAVDGVINQINPQQFTLKAYYNGIKHLGIKNIVSLIIKEVVFHYRNDDYGIRLYREIVKYAKTIKHKKSRIKHVYFVFNIVKFVIYLIPILLFWIIHNKKIYPLAEYTPLFFEHELNGQTFTVFQTLEMINFKNALHSKNLDLLIKEKGLFIAHTYFSAPMNYHDGKIFGEKDKINTGIEERFNYLSQKMALEQIWNPTLSELIGYMEKTKHVKYDCNKDGEIFISNNELISRQVR